MPRSRAYTIERAKTRRMPPVPAPRSRADAVLDGDSLYTMAEAAAILLITAGSVKNAIYGGRLHALSWRNSGTNRHQRRVRHSDLAKYLRQTDTVMSEEEAKASIERLRAMRRAMESTRRGRVNDPASTSKPQTPIDQER